MLPIRTILCGTDFSPCSEYAFHLASALARDYKARLFVAHVRELPAAAFGEFGTAPPAEDDAEVVRERLFAMKPPDGVDVKYLLTEGTAAPALIRLAEEHGCDLIVLGSHGRRGIERLLMGSVAELVVRRAKCPVLVIKHPLAEGVPQPEVREEPVAV